MPILHESLLEQAPDQASDGTGYFSEAEISLMPKVSDYNTQHPRRSRGSEDGSVVPAKTKTKQWEGIYHAYVVQPDGSTKRITRRRIIGLQSEFTKTQAREEHRVWVANFHKAPQAKKTGPHEPTVADIAADYINFKKGDWGPDGAGGMESNITCGIVPALGHLRLKDVTAEDLRAYVHSLPNRVHAFRPDKPAYPVKKGASKSYVNKTIGNLRGMFALAVERDLIVKNPAQSILVKLTIPKGVTKVNKSVFPPAQLPALLAELKTRDRLIVWISILGALRPSELFAIHGDDVGPTYLAIRHALDRKRKIKDTKTECDRIVSLSPQLSHSLHEWIRDNQVGPDDLVFSNRNGGPLIVGDIRDRVLRRAAKRANIPTVRVGFQMLRRSFSTIAAAIGFDVKSIQSQLGHSKPDMSYTEYVQPVDAQRDAHMARLENILLGLAPMPFDITKKLGSERVQ